MQDKSFLELKVLVVDQDMGARQWAESVLSQLGVASVEHAESRAAALELLSPDRGTGCVSYVPDIIIAELQLPDGDSVEMLRALSELGASAAIILLSGVEPRLREAGEDLARARGLRILGSLAKPLTVSGLGDILSRHAFERTADVPTVALSFTQDELSRAIEGHELLIYYQPKISLGTGVVMGVEALIRWLHPEHGLLPPDAFVPTLVTAGLIEPLTHRVLEKALGQLRTWLDAGLTLQVSVNVPAACLDNLELPLLLDGLLKAHNVPASLLCLEITESGIVQSYANALDVLTRLRLKGVSVSIDDFGTGYATISRLAKLPFDELKLDRSLVTEVHLSDRMQTILSSTIALAKDLRIKVVAEGVETIAEWKILDDLGCDAVQGFYVAMPMPGEQMHGWMSTWVQQREKVISSTPLFEI